MKEKLIDNGADFAQLQQHAQELESSYGERDKEFIEYERMYLMDWKDKPEGSGIKVTMSPDARNSILGVVRLLTATDPQWEIPGKQNGDEIASRIEVACADIWDISGKVAQIPIHYDAVLSAALYGEVHIPITSTADLVEYARQSNSGQERAEKIASQTPFLFEVWNPRGGYPEFDGLGLTAYYRKSECYAYELPLRFGESAQAMANEHGRYDRVTLNVWYDLVNYAVWVDQQLIQFKEHGLPGIPVAVSISEGSRLFDKPEQQIQPHLYTVKHSGLWERENLALTVLFTHLFNIGINPTFVYTRGPNDTTSQPDHDAETGRVTLNYGSSYQPMANKGIIDPSFQTALAIVEQKFEESTIYRQALGQNLEGSQPYSTVALLSQSGRLPLVNLQKRTAWVIGTAMEFALKWWKKLPGSNVVKGVDLKPGEIPDDLLLDVKLDVSLPQDKLQQSQIAIALKQSGLTSKEWVRQNILNIGQSDEIERQVWNETADEINFQQFLQKQMRAEQAQEQAQAQQQQAMMRQQQMPGQGGIPPQQQPAQGQGIPQQEQGQPVVQPEQEGEMMP